MLKTKTIATQTARRKAVINLALTLIVSSFSFAFFPHTFESPILIFAGLSVIVYICVYSTMGLRSKITVNKEQKYTISIPDYYSNINSQIPVEYITHAEVCEYKLFNNNSYYPTGVNKDYFQRKTMLGYMGTGLIVCYQLPRSMTGDSIVRGIRFPAPKANEFLSIIEDNAHNLS